MHQDHVTIERLKKAHHRVAQLVMIDRIYLPLFERLEREIAEREQADSVYDRAKAVANG